MLWSLKGLIESCNSSQRRIDGKWFPARPEPGPLSYRLHAAWMVLTGKADAFTWPGGQ